MTTATCRTWTVRVPDRITDLDHAWSGRVVPEGRKRATSLENSSPAPDRQMIPWSAAGERDQPGLSHAHVRVLAEWMRPFTGKEFAAVHGVAFFRRDPESYSLEQDRGRWACLGCRATKANKLDTTPAQSRYKQLNS